MKRSEWNSDLAGNVMCKRDRDEEKKSKVEYSKNNDARITKTDENQKQVKRETEKLNLSKEKWFDLGKLQ